MTVPEKALITFIGSRLDKTVVVRLVETRLPGFINFCWVCHVGIGLTLISLSPIICPVSINLTTVAAGKTAEAIIERTFDCLKYVEEFESDSQNPNCRYVRPFDLDNNMVIIKGNSNDVICRPD